MKRTKLQANSNATGNAATTNAGFHRRRACPGALRMCIAPMLRDRPPQIAARGIARYGPPRLLRFQRFHHLFSPERLTLLKGREHEGGDGIASRPQSAP
ncbi:hypothetical protein [Paraburkholderia sp. Cpub6]|uniref:hypothetical protein n=1 Tax=Paraburkholderia sp. Cpub6 TaxID=2723094 RepID=UPI001619AC0F|nr:hypothetical protein [Paraburkholderia sp. Cpub6]MBB5460784.1 hypothetical protein [Paraburkholderia sp. Cpub6]